MGLALETEYKRGFKMKKLWFVFVVTALFVVGCQTTDKVVEEGTDVVEKEPLVLNSFPLSRAKPESVDISSYIHVFYGPTSEVVTLGNFSVIDERINDWNFLYELMELQPEPMMMTIFDFRNEVDITSLSGFFTWSTKFEPANFFELAAYSNYKYLRFISDDDVIVATNPETFVIDQDGQILMPCLSQDGIQKKMGLCPMTTVLPGNYRFLSVYRDLWF